MKILFSKGALVLCASTIHVLSPPFTCHDIISIKFTALHIDNNEIADTIVKPVSRAYFIIRVPETVLSHMVLNVCLTEGIILYAHVRSIESGLHDKAVYPRNRPVAAGSINIFLS